jgi:ABC-2 type transport system permease protein
MAPAIAAGALLAAFAIGARHLPSVVMIGGSGEGDPRGPGLAAPYEIAAVLITLVSVVVSVVYCLGALQAERRDRSILFWKSLPVSDLITVLSKALVPLVVIPVAALGVILATEAAMLLWSTALIALKGLNPAPLWSKVTELQTSLVVPYGVAALALWNAPLFAWLLLVSGWAKRATFLWAFLAPFGACILEKIAFGTSHLFHILGQRLSGGMSAAFRYSEGDPNSFDSNLHPDPVGFLSNPALWIGLALAAAFLAATVWLRRYREPI